MGAALALTLHIPAAAFLNFVNKQIHVFEGYQTLEFLLWASISGGSDQSDNSQSGKILTDLRRSHAFTKQSSWISHTNRQFGEK